MTKQRKDVMGWFCAVAWVVVCVLTPMSFAAWLFHDPHEPAMFADAAGEGVTRFAVPGGWIYHVEGVGITFVPEAKEEQR